MTLFSRGNASRDILLGDRARDAGDWIVAAQHYREALQRNPNNFGIWVQLGHTLKESGQLRPAEGAYRRALDRAPQVADTHLQLAHVLKLQGRLEEAKAAYLCALALTPDSHHAQQELKAFQWGDEELVQARHNVSLLKPMRARRRRGARPIERADRARDVGDWQEATKFYQKALDRDPDRAGVWVQYGHAMKEKGDAAGAEMAYRTALDYESGAADTHRQLGHVLKILERPDEAQNAYLRAYALDPSLPDLPQELGSLGWTENELCELRRQLTGEDLTEEDLAFTPELAAEVALPVDLAPEPSPAVADGSLVLPDPSTMPNRQQLRDYLIDEEVGEHATNRILDYFRVVEAIRLSAGSTGRTRPTVVTALLERMRLLAQAANDARPIEASVVVPVFNCLEYTAACVLSLLEHRCDTRYEIIIADDHSTDETRQLFSQVGGVVSCSTATANGGFLLNCNRAAKESQGNYLILLNNDTFVLDDWLDELLLPFTRFENIGLTGSKLLMADGTLQEAGGIIWRDGSGWNFGRGQNPRDCQFNYVKDTDYASGAAVAVPRALWEELGGFDERYIPAYAEDTDLAFQIRSRGLRTLYVPHSQVIHHEGASHGTDINVGLKAYQAINGVKFVDKWRSVLEEEHYPNGEEVYLARDRTRDRKHLLVFDHYVPKFDRDGGSRMMYDFLKLFVDAGLHVMFWPDNGHYDRPYARTLQGLGVEVLYGPEVPDGFGEWIKRNGRYLDYAFLHRPHVSRNYIDALREHSPAKCIYYGADLHFRRFEKEYALTGRPEARKEAEESKQLEGYVWERSDVIYYPAEEEVKLVRQLVPDRPVWRFPVQLYSDEGIRAARARVGESRPLPPTLLYVAGFAHRPNADAFLWFAREVLPLIKAQIPECVAICAGSFPPRSITNLADKGIVVTEAISWPVLDWFYHAASVVIGPIRYGGGMKGKLLEALRYGVPVVTTPAGAEGFDDAPAIMAIGDTPQAFADQVVKIVRDPSSATERVLNGLDYVESQFSYSAVAARLAVELPELNRVVQGDGRLRRQVIQQSTR